MNHPPYPNQPEPEPLLLIPKSEIRPLDVLMGRGHFHHGGNSRFLRIVSGYKSEYVSQKNYVQKERIAREVMELVYDPAHLSGAEDGFDFGETKGGGEKQEQLLPGRFLQLETGDAYNTGSDSDPTYYRVISGKPVLDKIKMNLRQKPRWGKDAASRGGRGNESSSGRAGGKAGTYTDTCNAGNEEPRRRRSSNSNKGKRRAADSSSVAKASSSSAGTNVHGSSIMLETGEGGEFSAAAAGNATEYPEERYLAELLEDELIFDEDELFFDEDDLVEDLQNLGDDDKNQNDLDQILGNGGISPQISMPATAGNGTSIHHHQQQQQQQARQQLLANVAIARRRWLLNLWILSRSGLKRDLNGISGTRRICSVPRSPL